MRGRIGTDIGIKLLPVMWVFLCISTVHEVQYNHKHTVLCIPVSELVSCTFSTIAIYMNLLVLYSAMQDIMG